MEVVWYDTCVWGLEYSYELRTCSFTIRIIFVSTRIMRSFVCLFCLFGQGSYYFFYCIVASVTKMVSVTVLKELNDKRLEHLQTE